LDENHNLTEMDSNTAECHLEVKADRASFICEKDNYLHDFLEVKKFLYMLG
jgi:hypothetical protein